MTGEKERKPFIVGFYLFGSRPLTHIVFWLCYYVMFSLIWVREETGYFASFYLEFVLLPARLIAVYAMLYVLIPRYLVQQQYRNFFINYAGLLVVSALIYRIAYYFFYQKLLLGVDGVFFDGAAFVRAVLLVNSTVLVLAAVKIFQLFLREKEKNENGREKNTQIAIRADRRTHLVEASKILYIEGLGNYVTYYLTDGEKLVSYSSIKAAFAELPSEFLRLHRSYIVNRSHIQSYTAETVSIAGNDIPRGKSINDGDLAPVGQKN